MKRLAALALAVFAATQADGQGSASACYLGASFTTCYKPVNHASMEGPAATSTSGYLSSTDWVTFNSGVAASVPSTRTISTTAPLTGGGDLSANRVFAITQSATAANGYLSSTDWNTFNSKVGTATAINTTAPLAGGGDLTTSRTLSITQAATAANGYLSSTDWNTFNGKQAALSVTAPITLAANTVAITQSATAANGYLSSTDWNTFNNKDQARTVGNLTEATSSVLTITGGTGSVIGSGTSLQVIKSDGTHSGYLASGDWTSFNTIAKVMTTAGDVIYGGVAGAPTRLGIGGANTVLHGGASAPAYSAVADGDLTGQVTVAHGGTGIASGTSGGVPYFSGTTTIASSGALTANGVVLGGGAGTTPTTTAACTTANQVLRSGSPPACGALVAADLPAATSSAAGSVTFEATTSWSPSFTGARSTTASVWYASRVGGIVTLVWSRDVGSSCSGNNLVTAASSIPSGFRPGRSVFAWVWVQNNNAQPDSPGELSAQADGSITINRSFSTAAFTNAANCGYYEGAVSYNVQ